ncbi:DUF1217 domain-containing protein [Histidinibacterium lentulum]|uniref:DUF1217 domain-containing protein n=1 Tax=Histidinibacterium lentulum TaxID=2480588 RepID=A0A3N2R732_9RHOB|nr:DUF1217 domain-containing protein [Histidinibacterium lentulum]ROU03254.1 DUF1217 domain-containing protein [Histidinibacterium lentulum]
MTFRPVVPLGGYAGWRFLDRTLDTQKSAFAESAPVARLTDHVRTALGRISSVDDFMADRRLLEVALGAFGLEADVGNRAFIRKILAEGTLSGSAFARRLGDTRYEVFSRAMGFGDLGGAGRTQFSGFADTLISRYESRAFARAVGEQNNDLRLALNLDSGLADLLASTEGTRARWFALMGDPPLRRVFETALGFGPGFGRIDLDQQLDQFRQRARSVLGTDDPADFAAPDIRERVVRLFMVRSESLASQSASPNATALILLQGAARFG